MINIEKTRLMAKCQIYENNEGAEDIEISKYFKPDYVRYNVVISIVLSTIGFFLILGMYIIYNLDTFLENAFMIDYKQLATKVIGFYIIFLLVYITISILVYGLKFKYSRARLAAYFKTLSKINKLNEKDERIKDLEDY